ncbi:MAG TPA: hypothetical protein VMU54_03360 [Planctomycetota bacterium]|nr:hypothetical protein [Planctomycetota bacterium]
MPEVAGLIAAKFALYVGVFYLLGLLLQIGVPFDALRAGFHRSWMGAAATMVCLVGYMITRMLHASPETVAGVVRFLTWVLRLAIWTWVVTSVYRVTRWRKGKLAILMAVVVALDIGIDAGLAWIQQSRPFMPAMGEWTLELC